MRPSQLAMTVAFRALRLTWRLRRPHHQGALVALWHGDRVLGVRQAYQRVWTFPGGGVRRGEWAQAAAARELAEEVGVWLPVHALRLALHVERTWNHRLDRVRLFEVDLAAAPELRLQTSEIAEVRWFRLSELSSVAVPPHLHDYVTWRKEREKGVSQRPPVVA